MNAGEVLRNTAYRLSQKGAWSHHGWGNGSQNGWNLQEGTSHCVVGAIYRELGYETPIGENRFSVSDTEEIEYLAKYLGIKRGGIIFKEKYWSPLTAWNNAKERTQEEVVAALMGASELYDKEHIHKEEVVEV
jgi:hypothetical protein